MRYVQLRAFHHVAICGGFSRAAEELFLTQPAISDQVRKLEEEYDVILFNRHKKQVTITSAGEKLLEITRRLFDSEQQARDLLSESRALRSGTLKIIADSAHHVLHILATFRNKHPGVQISIRTGNSEDVIARLHDYTADIGVLGDFTASKDFNVIRLNATPISAFVASSHPLASRKSFTLSELSGLPLVMREQGSKTRRKVEEAAERAGVVLEAGIEAEGREAVREIVAAGSGIGFVSEAEFGNDKRLVRIPVSGTDGMTMEESLICLKDRAQGKLVSAFFNIARSMVKSR
ncbi:MAG: LysR substrate-binding domain-containing protein [Rhizobiaceae bacterium]